MGLSTFLFGPKPEHRYAGQASAGEPQAEPATALLPLPRFSDRWVSDKDGFSSFTFGKVRITIFPVRKGRKYSVEELDRQDPDAYTESRAFLSLDAAKVGALKEYLSRTTA